MKSFDRHKVFISFCHVDQDYKEYLTKMKYYDDIEEKYYFVFDNYSVGDGDIDDSKMTSEQIRRKIRDEYIKDATVFILLCGKTTKYRKHIDWEIHAAMYDSDVNPKMGILIINLPDTNMCVRAFDDNEKKLVSDIGDWISLNTREEYEKYYPYMPARIIDNFMRDDVSISVVNWSRIENDSKILLKLIDNAFRRRENNNYDHSRPLRKKNS